MKIRILKVPKWHSDKVNQEAERAKEAFDSLSPEEQVAIMQNAAAQEQQAQEAAIAEQAAQEQTMQQEAMAEQQAAEEQALAEQNQMQQPSVVGESAVEQPQVQAEGGEIETNEFPDGGELNKHFIINDDGTYTEIGEDALEGLELQSNIDKEIGDDNQIVYKHYYKKPVAQTRAAVDDGVVPEVKAAKAKNSEGEDDEEDDTEPKLKFGSLRYAGLLGPFVGLGMMASGVGKPDYRGIDRAVAIADSGAPQIGTRHIGNYLTYRPMDIWAEQNRLNANARATDRAILNSTSPARMAALLASGYNNQLAGAELYRKALEYNDAKRTQVGEFNRGTDQFNASASNATAATNAQLRAQDKQGRIAAHMNAAQQKLENNTGWYNSLYRNVNNIFEGLGNLGRENAQHNMIAALAASGAFPGVNPDNDLFKQYIGYKRPRRKKKGV